MAGETEDLGHAVDGQQGSKGVGVAVKLELLELVLELALDGGPPASVGGPFTWLLILRPWDNVNTTAKHQTAGLSELDGDGAGSGQRAACSGQQTAGGIPPRLDPDYRSVAEAKRKSV
ncbi:GL25176 [Drosophila persimilis]|uniref:GL25176 n=1 Tax=Drosophila persimilis TaxID=7234 RepID=B4GRB3_DROPE|nr:GL25176 [Drosophila persimilis]